MIRDTYRHEREELLESIREIQLLSGLTELRFTEPQTNREPLMLAGNGPGLRGFKAMRGSGHPRATAPARDPSSPRSIAIGVTSPGYGEGKTTIAIALASCLAQDFGAQVTLVDADFHTASVSEEYGLEGRKGLADVLDGEVSLQAVTHRFLRAPLSVVTAGTAASSPARIARSERLVELIDAMKATSGFVVMDLPATLQSMTAPVLAQRCDGVLIVVRDGQTTRRELERTLDLHKDANVLGVVLNRRKSRIPGWAERLFELAS